MSQFKYFLNPEKFAYILEGVEECDICHETIKCFDGSTFYGEEEYGAFCFECVAVGRLDEVGASAVDPDYSALVAQLRELHPDISKEEIEKVAINITHGLEISTPKLPTWQDWFWPAHCGDYCQFFQLAGQQDFNNLASDGNGKGLFADSLYYDLKDVTDVDYVWSGLKPGSIKSIKDFDSSPMAYIFRCLNCGQIVTIWDCN